MLFNILDADENPSGVISYFRGLNRRFKGSPGEFSDMKNMSSSAYPCMAPRAGRRYIDDNVTDRDGAVQAKRFVIPPLNKTLDSDVPRFTGIAGRYFYYEGGGPISAGSSGFIGEFSQGHKEAYEYRFDPMAYDGIQYLDVSELFPDNADVEFSYCYMNNRLFIFVTSSTGLDDLGYDSDHIMFTSSDISEYIPTRDGTFENLYGNVITVNDSALAAAAPRMKGRNAEIWGRSNANSYCVMYYITDVTVNGSEVKITLNEPINANPFMERGNSKSVSFELYLHKDRGKYYYDAGKSSTQVLHNMERGVCNIACNIRNENYTDTTLGITYFDTDVVECSGSFVTDRIDFSRYFAPGDFIKISGCYYSENNTVFPDSNYTEVASGEIVTTHIVGIEVEDGGSRMYIQNLDADGNTVHMREEVSFRQQAGGSKPYVKTYCVTKIVPNMCSVTAHNQRLWGVNKNGEYFYASMASDPFTWFRWEAEGASDPLEIESGTKDEYTGVLEYGQYVLLLKPTSIQQVYSLASASTVQIARAMYNVGCLDIKSALVIGSTAYYLGYNGFYRYSGAEPELISDSLNTRYISASAFTDGVKYYASATREDGETEMVVFDTRYGFWHKEDDTAVLGSFLWYDKAVVVTDTGETYVMNAADKDIKADGARDVIWSAESVSINEGTFYDKTVSEIWLRAYIPKGCEITIYTETNGSGKWVKHTTFESADRIKVYRTSVRPINCEEYRIRIEGRGQCVIYDLERVVPTGGRNYNPSRERGRM